MKISANSEEWQPTIDKLKSKKCLGSICKEPHEDPELSWGDVDSFLGEEQGGLNTLSLEFVQHLETCAFVELWKFSFEPDPSLIGESRDVFVLFEYS